MAIKENKECFRGMYLNRNFGNIEQYKVARKIENQAVSKARG
jgi:hypothetical protein